MVEEYHIYSCLNAKFGNLRVLPTLGPSMLIYSRVPNICPITYLFCAEGFQIISHFFLITVKPLSSGHATQRTPHNSEHFCLKQQDPIENTCESTSK